MSGIKKQPMMKADVRVIMAMSVINYIPSLCCKKWQHSVGNITSFVLFGWS